MARIALLSALIITPLFILADAWLPDVQNLLPLDPLIGNGLLPAIFLLITIAGFYYGIKKHFNADVNESVQALFVLIAAIFIVLTITGIWLRGTDMQLVWPWQVP